MKLKSKNIKLFTFILAALMRTVLAGQTSDTIPQSQQVANAWFCAPDDYFWIYRGDTLQNGETYYLCPQDTVNFYGLTLVPKNPSTMYDSIIWLNDVLRNKTTPQSPDNSFKFFFKYNGKQVTISSLAYKNNISQTYTINITNKVDTMATLVASDSTYLYDDNKIKEYWPSYTPKPKTPWQFIPVGSAVNGTVTNDSWRGKTVKSTAPSSTKVHPLKLASRVHPVNIQSLSQVSNTQSMIIADCVDTLLQVMSFAPRTEVVDFYVLCQANDEKQINFGRVANNTTVCIEPGFSRNIIDAEKYNRLGDSIMMIGSRQVVVAGKDSICSNKILPYKPKCPPRFNIHQLIKECNSVYEQVGINFVLGTADALSINWDLNGNDKLDYLTELTMIRNNYFEDGNNSLIPSKTKVILIDIIASSSKETTVNGRASGFGANSLALSSNCEGYTLAHEIGHAKYGFRHPDNDPNHLWEEGEIREKANTQFGFKNTPSISDDKNYMYSTSTGRTNNMRAYQIRKIFLNTY